MQQSGDAIAGMAITPTVSVAVKNNVGATVTKGPDSTAAITVTIASGGTNNHLFGTTTVNAVDGVASFSDLKIDLAGTYRLGASSKGIDPATSSSFVISGQAARCKGSGCELQDKKASSSNRTSWSVDIPSCPASEDDVIFLSVRENDPPSADLCGGEACLSNKVFFTSECLTAHPDLLTTSTLAIHKSALRLDKGASHVTVYFQDAEGNIHALEKCPNSGLPSDKKACVVSETKSPDGTALITIVSRGDPAYWA